MYFTIKDIILSYLLRVHFDGCFVFFIFSSVHCRAPSTATCQRIPARFKDRSSLGQRRRVRQLDGRIGSKEPFIIGNKLREFDLCVITNRLLECK